MTTNLNRPSPFSQPGRWPVHQFRRITMSYEKLCPVHRGPIAMSGRRVAHVRPPIESEWAGGPGLAFETWEAARLAIEQTFNVTGPVNEMEDLDPIASRQIENQPVFEAFYRPAAEAAQGWTAKGAK